SPFYFHLSEVELNFSIERFPAGLHLTFSQFTARTALKHPQKICSLEKIPFSVCASVKKNHSEIMIRKDLRIAQVQFLYF
ncbi:hypothetical protein, partial [Holdemania massiliensis]|uniref:hypothetical protein n=1 Tax=Holdemania massiliensis TaxID=1468449 RepID=UPI002676F713